MFFVKCRFDVLLYFLLRSDYTKPLSINSLAPVANRQEQYDEPLDRIVLFEQYMSTDGNVLRFHIKTLLCLNEGHSHHRSMKLWEGIFTARVAKRAKVMFSQACVTSTLGGGGGGRPGPPSGPR